LPRNKKPPEQVAYLSQRLKQLYLPLLYQRRRLPRLLHKHLLRQHLPL
jgi:hypothetical protein